MGNELNNPEGSYELQNVSDNQAAQKASDALDVAVGLLEDIQKVVGQGRPKKLRVRLGDKVIAELPLALTAAAAVATGLAAVLLTKLTIEIEHEDQ